MKRFSSTLSLVTTALLLAATTTHAENWPQWRGPKNDGHSSEKGLPTEWGPDKNILWKFKMPGHGSSTPCIWEDKIFVTSMEPKAGTPSGKKIDDNNRIVLLCIGTDGKLKWKHTLSENGKAGYRGEGDDASASCSTDGKHVWSFDGSGKLECFTVEGKPVWNVDIQKYGKFGIQFGIHWTPVLYKGRLYLQVMHRGAQAIVTFDAATGKELWKVNRPGYGIGESPDTYASAFMWEGEGGPLLIAHGNDFCTAHQITDGKEVWRVENLNPATRKDWRFVSSPLVTPDLIVVPSCKNGPTVALNPVGAKGKITPENKAELWRLNSTPDVVPPLLVDGIVYLLSDGPLTALEAKTGAKIYGQSLPKQIYRSNMVYADGNIYVVGREGIGAVFSAGKDFKLLATNDLKEKVYASPAISNGKIYIRTWDNLYCVGTK